MKIATVVGHNRNAKGAETVIPVFATRNEFDYNSKLAELMNDVCDDLGIDGRTFFREPVTVGTARQRFEREISTVYAATDAWGADVTIELHYNSHNSNARGTETLTSGFAMSNAVALAVQDRMVDLYDRDGRLNRGVKTRRSGRGSLSLKAGRAPAILVEPFFGSSRRDCELAERVGAEALAHAYISGILEGMNWHVSPDAMTVVTNTTNAHML